MSEQNSLDEISVAEYLASNPDFFSQHSELLANMYVPAQNGAGTISLVERQQQAQREKIRQLEINYSNLLRIGNQNDAISEKLHHFTLHLFAQQQYDACIASVQTSMRHDFNVDDCQILALTDGSATTTQSQQVILDWLNTQSEPYCGDEPISEIRAQFVGNEVSFACIPLPAQNPKAVLILASQDGQRFYAGMGTMFLKRIGELVSLALQRCAS